MSPLAFALGRPTVSGRIRCSLEDFRVEEQLGYEPEGEGEHLWLYLRKRGTNTDWSARALARWAGVGPAAVSYAGMKDRHAVTDQWFSIHLPGRPDPDPDRLGLPELTILDARRHRRKLQRGGLKSNRFHLVVRQLLGETDSIPERLQRLQTLGVPNYFGAQRFGHDGANVDNARRLFVGELRRVDRHRRGLYLSAARARLFNEVLSRRVRDDSWRLGMDGDLMMLDGSHSVFATETLDDELHTRLARLDIHPSGPLWGRDGTRPTAAALVLEQEVAETDPELRDGLVAAGVRAERRALRLALGEAECRLGDAGTLELVFSLPAGAYATVVLRELLEVSAARAMTE
jgi:tRNA pseudouridine13 synthase